MQQLADDGGGILVFAGNGSYVFPAAVSDGWRIRPHRAEVMGPAESGRVAGGGYCIPSLY